jgi:hypothetical protein
MNLADKPVKKKITWQYHCSNCKIADHVPSSRRRLGDGYPVVRPPAYNLFTKQFGGLVCPLKGAEVKPPGVGPAIVLLLAIATQTCPSVAQGSTSSQETPEKSSLVRTGPWGGQDVEMQVNEHGATVEFACAHGNISEPLVIDAKGQFRARGTFQRQHGGPNRRNELRPA